MNYSKKSKANYGYKVTNLIFFVYQGIFPSSNRNCRYEPTCSAYSKAAVEKYGFILGSWLSLKRILTCHPYSKKAIIDPLT